MLVLGIRTKILILIMAATIVPLIILNIFWTSSQRQSLITGTQSRQALIASGDAEKVNDFTSEKVRTLIIHSQSPSLQQFNLSKATLEISTLLYQDKDLTRAALVNQQGQEVVALTSDLKPSPLQNVQSSDAFKVVNYFAGNEYISPVATDSKGQPMVTIAIPLVTFTTPQELGTLSTAEPGVIRNPQDIKGALIVQASLENLWNSVLSTANNANNTATPGDGYAYVVNDKGLVIAHPDSTLTNAHKDLSATPIVTLFKNNLGNSNSAPESLQAVSEKDVPVMATYQKVTSTDWGVIFEEPMSSIYKSVSRVSDLGLAISAAAILVMGLLSFWLSRYITKPVLRIAYAAEQIGHGDFAARVILKRRRDEIGKLAGSINGMGENLQAYIGRIDTQRRQLEIILNSTTDGILAIGRTGSVIIANQATAVLSERPTDKVIGANIQMLFPWVRDAAPFTPDYQADGTTTHAGLQYTSPSGVVHYINLIAVQAANQTIITLHDETKSRDLENMKIDFVSMAAHELRTPLSRIRGYLELISSADQVPVNDEHVQKYLTQARNSTVELSTLISNLLDVSRIERGTLVLAMDKFDLADCVTQSVQGLHFNASAKQINLTYSGPERGNYVVADSVALREVIDNLIDNAIKYTLTGGRVAVSLAQRGDSLVVHVKDTGVGIPANALPYLFTKFYRVHGGLESGSAGTGLGLFISKSIIERHNGTIAVESNEGHGSVFTVTVPVFTEARLAAVHKLKGIENVSRRRGWTTKNITR